MSSLNVKQQKWSLLKTYLHNVILYQILTISFLKFLSKTTKTLAYGCHRLPFEKNQKNLLMMGKIPGQIQGKSNAINTEPLLMNTTVYHLIPQLSSKQKSNTTSRTILSKTLKKSTRWSQNLRETTGKKKCWIILKRKRFLLLMKKTIVDLKNRLLQKTKLWEQKGLKKCSLRPVCKTS